MQVLEIACLWEVVVQVLVSEYLLNKFGFFDVYNPNPLSELCIVKIFLGS